MSKKTKFGVICTTLLAMLLVFLVFAQTYADNTKYVGIVGARNKESNDEEYTVLIQGVNRTVWKLVTYSSQDPTDPDYGPHYDEALYCICPEVGFEAGSGIPVTYNESFNMKDFSQAENKTKYIAMFEAMYGAGNYHDKYNSILWVLDNCYLPNKQSYTPSEESSKAITKQLLFDSVVESLQSIGYYADEEDVENGRKYLNELTDNDIDVVQQLAIWYFASPDDGPYHIEPDDLETIKLDTVSMEYIGDSNTEGYRLYGMQDLYRYFVVSGEANKDYYGNEETKSLPNPELAFTLPANNDTLTTIVNIGGTKYFKAGPFNYGLENATTLPYTLTGKVTDQNGAPVTDYILVDEDNINLGTTEIGKDLFNQDFYVAVPVSNTDITKIKVELEGSYAVTSTDAWINATNYPGSGVNVNEQEQPFVVVNKQIIPIEASKEVTVFRPNFDLSLRKFITAINGVGLTGDASREPGTHLGNLVTGASTTATYIHPKNALTVKTNDLVTYTIRVYNEGNLDGYVSEITDYIPEGLEFVADNETNIDYLWRLSEDRTKITTNYLSRERDDANVIAAFDKEIPEPVIAYRDVQVVFKVVAPSTSNSILRNIAEITDYTDEDGEAVQDIDSNPDEAKGNVDLTDYNPPEDNSEYQEDDDDYELLKLEHFDLSLRKFIRTITDTEDVTTTLHREPSIDITHLIDGTASTAVYTQPKDAVKVKTGYKVVYTIRVYNEGKIAGYATEIVDHIPEGLTFMEDSDINDEYGWVLSADGKTATTDYLKNTVINALDRNAENPVLDYKDVLIEFEVTEPERSDRVLRNIAEIGEDSDDDIDSTPNNVDLDDYYPPEDNSEYQEDDDDYEQLVLEYFDLALRKFITKIDNADVTTRVPEVDVTKLISGEAGTATYTHPKDIVGVYTGAKVVYTIRVYNEGKIDGTASEIVDYIPEGLKLVENSTINDEYGWIMYRKLRDGETVSQEINPDTHISINGETFVKTDDPAEAEVIGTYYLKDSIINAFDKTTGVIDYKDVKIEFEVIEPATSDRVLRNVAEITESTDEDGEFIQDIDSNPDGVTGNVDLNDYNPPADNSEYQEDDDDYERINLQYFDLSLRKFITKINTTEIDSRIPSVDVSKLVDGSAHTATYSHPKTALTVRKGDMVVYTIRVYNEGSVEGTATEIVDYIPEGLKFAENSTINSTYKWVLSENGKEARTDYLADSVINAFNKRAENPALDYKDVEIEFEVVAPNTTDSVLRNIAEISEDSGAQDIDSTPDNVDLNDYNPPADNSEYQQDDDDYEQIKLEYFDLSLRKFITTINEEKVTTSRVPVVNTRNLLDNSKTTATYTHPKDALTVKTGDAIVYTLRVYNEGKVDGFAREITDHIPEGLQFVVDSNINKAYNWVLSEDGKTATTNYLKDTVIRALDKFADPLPICDYKDVSIELKVVATQTTEEQILRNIAEISEDSDDDIDSTPDNVDLDNYNPPADNSEYQQDDDDYEPVRLEPIEVEKIFDLSLRKFITKVNNTEVTTRVPSVDVSKLLDGSAHTATYTHPKDTVAVRTGDMVVYTIRVYNEGEEDGYATELTDYVPEGLKLAENSSINTTYKWVLSEDGKTVTTDYLKDTLIKAFDKTAETPTLDYKDVSIEFEVIAKAGDEEKVLRNIAEISEDSDDDDDSTPDNADLDNYNPPADNSEYQEDDDDYEPVKLEPIVKVFDLSLRKFITKVNSEEITTREPVVDVSKLANGSAHTATYTHPKSAVKVETGDMVVYTIRVYNEGDVDGYVGEITDYVPEGLKFTENSSINTTYKWVLSEDGKTVTTDYLKDTLIKAFDRTAENPELDYKDVSIEFEVIAEPGESAKVLRNIAEISKDSDDDNDSTPDNADLDNYNPPADNSEYQEDDDDYEPVKLEPIEKIFDLSLRKFITKVNKEDVDTRYPVVTLNDEGKLEYAHSKEPVLVASNDIVIYTIRVYNEGEIAGYAKEVSDDIPDGLSYLPEHEINKQYGWVLSEDGQTVSTDYLSKEKSEEREEDNLLKAFDSTAEISETNPDFRDVKIAFKVIETNLASDRIIINTAEITDDSDENGNDVEDKDSTPGNNEPKEDDIDKEYLRVKYFDLSLLKWVSKTYVTENDQTTVKDTGHTGLENPEPVVKVDLDRRNINKVTVKFGYTIKITNEGEIAGYAKEISDYIPAGLKFVKEDNPDWEEKDGKIVTRKLENTLLNPGDSATVEVILTWINGDDNLDLKVNVAEISEDYNEHGSKDIDSIPNNKKDGEDDIDDAPVILTVRTGSEPTYIVLATSILVILTAGMILIKKYVLR
ncbi:MAG: DUF11 domain-containing protein [Clostridia bacterium]|nr:DUF11 domain-containing protein [Clostridia bacterium]